MYHYHSSDNILRKTPLWCIVGHKITHIHTPTHFRHNTRAQIHIWTGQINKECEQQQHGISQSDKVNLAVRPSFAARAFCSETFFSGFERLKIRPRARSGLRKVFPSIFRRKSAVIPLSARLFNVRMGTMAEQSDAYVNYTDRFPPRCFRVHAMTKFLAFWLCEMNYLSIDVYFDMFLIRSNKNIFF